MFLPGFQLPSRLRARLEHGHWREHLEAPALRAVPWLVCGAIAFCTLGLLLGLLAVPLDARQGDVQRIVYIHVPATWMAVLIYLLVALAAGIGQFLASRKAAMLAEAMAPTGALFAFMALWTGSLWGKPIWGSWWVWDLRSVADLTLLLLYIGLVAVRAVVDDPWRADRVVAWIALPGAAVVVAILASVALLPAGAAPGGAGFRVPALAALALVAIGFLLHSGAMALTRLRCVILERDYDLGSEAVPRAGTT